jgi:hypothetical protein
MSAPSSSTTVAPPTQEALGYQIPPLAVRILLAATRLILSFIFFVAIPVALLAYVHSRGIAIPISVAAVTTWGAVLLVLAAARYVFKPTVAFGPLTIIENAVFFAYLYYLVTLSPYRFVFPGGTVSVAAGYSMFLEILMIVPVVYILSGILTTLEDLWSPGERLPFDYPA